MDQVAVKPNAIMHIGFWLVFMAYLSNAVISGETPFIFQARIVLKPLVSLIGRLIACSARISVDTQTDRQTDKPTTVTLAAHARRGLIIALHSAHEKRLENISGYATVGVNTLQICPAMQLWVRR